MYTYGYSLILKKITKRNKLVLVTFLLIFISELYYVFAVVLYRKYSINLKKIIPQVLMFWNPLCYFTLGVLIRKKLTKINISKKIFIFYCILFIVMLCCFVFIIPKLNLNDGYAENYYPSLIIKVLSLFTFLIMININYKKEKLVIDLSKATFGAYIIQILILKIIKRIYNGTNFVYNIIEFFILVILSLGISIIINKTKIGKKIFSLKIIN